MQKSMHLSPKYEEFVANFNRRPVICTSIRANSPRDYLNDLARATDGGTDIAELRIDFFNTITPEGLNQMISKSKLPLIVSNRNLENGGYFSKGEELRLSLIASAIEAKPAFIDIELSTNDKHRDNIIELAKENGVGLICSYHDFNSTPNDTAIYEIYRKMSEAGADLNKLVFTPQIGKHVRTILQANDSLSNETIPYTLFGMGEKGHNTRLISLLLGSCLTYCSLDSNPENTLYQMSLEETKAFFRLIEKRGWQYMRERRSAMMTLAMIEYNDDSSYPLKSIDSLIA